MSPGVRILDPGDGEGKGRRRHQNAEHPRAWAQGHVERLEPLDDRADPLPEANAHGLESVALLAALELVEQRGHEPRPRAAEWVAEGNGPAIDVDALHVVM